jgi:hypothetical protein
MKKKKVKAVKPPKPVQETKSPIEKGAINFINREKPGYLSLFRKGGSKYKGLRFCHGEIPVDIIDLGIAISGNENYWRENDYKRFKAWVAKNNPNSSDNKVITGHFTEDWMKKTMNI